jgi:hypothetical protein
VKTKPSVFTMAWRGLALYAVSYGLYWAAAWGIGSPHEFRNLWAKSLIPLAVVLAAMYLDKTNSMPNK